MKNSKSEIDEYIGSRIRECRQALHLSQELLARALGVSYQQVQNYEKGANGISAVGLFDICRLLNVPLETMFPPVESKSLPRPATDQDCIIGHPYHCRTWNMKASIDGHLIRNHQVELRGRLRAVRKRAKGASMPI
jgi:transcriptional regulator with XRE-family HTH domain